MAASAVKGVTFTQTGAGGSSEKRETKKEND
jgi:hypothetical protein